MLADDDEAITDIEAAGQVPREDEGSREEQRGNAIRAGDESHGPLAEAPVTRDDEGIRAYGPDGTVRGFLAQEGSQETCLGAGQERPEDGPE